MKVRIKDKVISAKMEALPRVKAQKPDRGGDADLLTSTSLA